MQITDDRAKGLTKQIVDPLRYSSQEIAPYESAGQILRMIPQGARVLDVGCGTGSLSVLIRDLRHVEIIGLEPNAIRAERARENGLHVLTEELNESHLDSLGLFDVILFIDVLEHLVDPSAMLFLAKKFLKPSGSVMVSVPNVAHWTVRLNLLRGRFNYQESGIMDATHLRWFTQKSLEQLFETAGYKVVNYTVSAGTWMPIYSRLPLLRRINAKQRKNFVCRAARRWPSFFGCQHVIRAVSVDGT